jgi:hypothetical protein
MCDVGFSGRESLSVCASVCVMTRSLLPRHGRHGTDMELSTILLKYPCKLVWQMWSRRGPVVQQASA